MLSTMSVQKAYNKHFSITVNISLVEEESQPDSGQFLFSYRVRITNQSMIPAQLMSRHWVITDGMGRTEEVRGAGVIGLQPKIQPGQTFEYESCCPLTTSSGSMRGSYQMSGEDGQLFEIEIPEFYLVAPTALH
jgi:ApaG protein